MSCQPEGSDAESAQAIAGLLARSLAEQVSAMRDEIVRSVAIVNQAVDALQCDLETLYARLQPPPEGFEAGLQQAIARLQFQDMLLQLLAHGGRRLAAMEEIIGEQQRWAEHGASTATSASPGVELNRLTEKCEYLKQQLMHNPVRQSGFAGGGIELFS